jgi:tryptophan synthase beta chain
MSDQTRFLLNESDLPREWYNLSADLPAAPAPVLHPQTLEPVTPDFLSVLFPMEIIMQEISTDRFIQISPRKCATCINCGAPRP